MHDRPRRWRVPLKLTRLLHTTGFDRIVPVTETIDEAVAALAEAGEASS
ncbi:MAG: hypothetical protein JJE52_04445 [Acidimicrobiia bacterium]|nr:hypothetical protein [Acidimicrobiia bacterium]